MAIILKGAVCFGTLLCFVFFLLPCIQYYIQIHLLGVLSVRDIDKQCSDVMHFLYTKMKAFQYGEIVVIVLMPLYSSYIMLSIIIFLKDRASPRSITYCMHVQFVNDHAPRSLSIKMFFSSKKFLLSHYLYFCFVHVGCFGVHEHSTDSEPDTGLHPTLPCRLSQAEEEQCSHWSAGHLCLWLTNDTATDGSQQVHWKICKCV